MQLTVHVINRKHFSMIISAFDNNVGFSEQSFVTKTVKHRRFCPRVKRTIVTEQTYRQIKNQKRNWSMKTPTRISKMLAEGQRASVTFFFPDEKSNIVSEFLQEIEKHMFLEILSQ